MDTSRGLLRFLLLLVPAIAVGAQSFSGAPAAARVPVNKNRVALSAEIELARLQPGYSCVLTPSHAIHYRDPSNVQLDVTCDTVPRSEPKHVMIMIWDAGTVAQARAGLEGSRRAKPQEVLTERAVFGDDSYLRRMHVGDHEEWGLLFAVGSLTAWVDGRQRDEVERLARGLASAIRAVSSPGPHTRR